MVVLDHVGRLQILVIDRVVVLDKSQRSLVVKVLPLALDLLMSPSEQHDCFPATVASFLAATQTPLRRLERALRFAIPAGRKDAHAIRQSSKGLYPEVYARLLTSGQKWLYGHIGARETGIPAIRLFGDGDRLRRPFDGPGPANRDTADLGQ